MKKITRTLAARFPLILVHWVDSSSRRGVWNPLEELRHDDVALACVSVGFLMKESHQSLTIAAHLTEHQGGGDMCIPTCAITKRTILKH